MAKKKTPVLPSGNYNKKVYDYTDSSGKRIYRSFTSDDEDELNFMVAEFKLRKKRTKGHPERMTLNEAIAKYISTSDAVLGAKTIEEYEKIQKNGFQMLMDVELEKITRELLIEAVNTEAKRPCKRYTKNPKPISPKTLKNEYGLISSVIKRYCPGVDTNVTLPAVQPPIKSLLPPEVIFEIVKGEEIELAVLIAMWLSFSASELRGLKRSSIHGNYIQIDQVIVDVRNTPVEKDVAKVDTRKRKHRIPPYIKELIDMLPEDQEYLIPFSASVLSKRWTRLLKRNGLPHMTFHELRHVNASVMASLHIPDKYAMERGGWKSDKVMKQTYTHTFDEVREKSDEIIDDFFERRRKMGEKVIPMRGIRQ